MRIGWHVMGCRLPPRNLAALRRNGCVLHSLFRSSHSVVDCNLVVVGPVASDHSRRIIHVKTLFPDTPLLAVGRLPQDTRIALLESGRCDTADWDCSVREIVLRMRNLLHLSHDVWRSGDWHFNLLQRRVRWRDTAVPLNAREWAVLLHLVRRAGSVISREALRQEIWQLGFDPGTNGIEVNICRIRQKLREVGAEGAIQTVVGEGYSARAGANLGAAG